MVNLDKLKKAQQATKSTINKYNSSGFHTANSKGGRRKKNGSLIANFDYKTLRSVMTAKTVDGFRKYGKVSNKYTGRYIYIDNGSDILAVGHMDTRLDFNHLEIANLKPDTWIFGANLDNRLGLYYLLHYLPAMGYKYDILLTENEEKGMSSAMGFTPPEGKKYNWMFSFDYRGEGVALYDYKDSRTESLLLNAGYTKEQINSGSYSDIFELEHLGCKGFNFGCGIVGDYHSPFTYASLTLARMSLVKFTRFYNTNVTHHLKHTPKSNYMVYPAVQSASAVKGKVTTDIEFEEVQSPDGKPKYIAKKDVKPEVSGTAVNPQGFVVKPSESESLISLEKDYQGAKILTLDKNSLDAVKSINQVLRGIPDIHLRIAECRKFLNLSESEMRKMVKDETGGSLDIEYNSVIKLFELKSGHTAKYLASYDKVRMLRDYISFLARKLCIPEELIIEGPEAMDTNILTILYPSAEKASSAKWQEQKNSMLKYIEQSQKAGFKVIVQDPWKLNGIETRSIGKKKLLPRAETSPDPIAAIKAVYGPNIDLAEGKQMKFDYGEKKKATVGIQMRTNEDPLIEKEAPKIKLPFLSKVMNIVKGRTEDGTEKQMWCLPEDVGKVSASRTLNRPLVKRKLAGGIGFSEQPIAKIAA